MSVDAAEHIAKGIAICGGFIAAEIVAASGHVGWGWILFVIVLIA